MSHHDPYTAIPKVLAVLPGNGGTKGKTDKLRTVEVGSEESVYMALTFCFDLYRRLLYMSKSAGPLREFIPPDLARQIQKDDGAIDAQKGWRGRARVAQRIMLRLHRELSQDWSRELGKAAKSKARV